jgi:ribosomal protein L37AE/L43A
VALLIASMGEALDEDERALFKELTCRDHEPGERVEEFTGVIGRVGGKSRAISVLAAYIAGLCDHLALVRGERGLLPIIAPDQRQAEIVLDYIPHLTDADLERIGISLGHRRGAQASARAARN